MARELKEFDAFGVKYRTQEFSAAYGFKHMDRRLDHPMEVLAATEVFVAASGSWARLDTPRAIDVHVRDVIGFLPAHTVLEGLLNVVRSLNWGFLTEWKMVKIPRRFHSNAPHETRTNVDPFMARLMSESRATKRELEEYYSLRDAFDMYDEICLTSLNGLLAQEQAETDAKKKAKSLG